MCSGAARALSWTNRDAIERCDVARRQAASRDVPQSIVVGIQQPDRGERITEQALDHVAEAIKNRAQHREIVEVRSCQGVPSLSGRYHPAATRGNPTLVSSRMARPRHLSNSRSARFRAFLSDFHARQLAPALPLTQSKESRP